jgi:hypothetical protein
VPGATFGDRTYVHVSTLSVPDLRYVRAVISVLKLAVKRA